MSSIPNHIAIIMDGNGRWAKEQGKNRSEGHKEGAANLERLALFAKELGVKILSVYAFSTDNFKRSEEEVSYLMNLLKYYFKNKFKKVCEEGIKIIFSGRRDLLKPDVLEAMDYISEKTKDNDNCILNICLNYGGQEEIIDASFKLANDINNKEVTKDTIKREDFYKYLYQDLPPIDLLIRTGKEHRISNFMLYQLYYAEMYFSDIYFPAFTNDNLKEAIEWFNNQDRRYGNVKTD